MVMETILSALFGGATGIIGSVINKVFGWLETKQKIELTKVEHAQELELLKLQQTGRQAEHENEQAIADTNAWKAARSASYRHDNFGTTSQWVTDTRSIFRPGLTIFLLVLSAAIYFTLLNDAAQEDIANQIIYMTSAAVLWWFGDRGKAYRKK